MQASMSLFFVLIASVFPSGIFPVKDSIQEDRWHRTQILLGRTISQASLLGVTLNASEHCLDVLWEVLGVGGPV